MEDKFNADLQGKVDAGIISKTFLDFDCNCRQPTMVNGKCMFGGRCREVCLIYGLIELRLWPSFKNPDDIR